MIQRLLSLILFTSFVSFTNAQLAIIGQNGETPDEMLLVALEEITSGEVFHITDNEYSHSLDQFTTGEGFVTFTSTDIVPEGEVFSVKNDGGWTIEGSNKLSVTSNSGSINFSFGDEQTYLFQTMDDLSSGDIFTIISVFDNWINDIPAENNPVTNYTDVIVIDLQSNVRNATYSGSREFEDIDDIMDLSNWTLSDSRIDLDLSNFEASTIPVELSFFNGRTSENVNYLFWETASEVDNELFVIERSKDGSQFEEIDYLFGQGTSLQVNEYEYMDERPYNGLNYYRLKQIDYNGQFTYSNSIVLENRKETEFTIFPTVTSDYINIELIDEEEGEISVYDSNGRVVLSHVAGSVKQLDCTSLLSGTYYMVLYSNNSTQSKRFIKQ